MTPTSSSGPLAGIVNSASKSSTDASSSLKEGRRSLGDGSNSVEKESKFSNILQSFSDVTSSENESNAVNLSLDGQALDPLDPTSLTLFGSALNQTGPGLTPNGQLPAQVGEYSQLNSHSGHVLPVQLGSVIPGQVLPGQAPLPGQALTSEQIGAQAEISNNNNLLDQNQVSQGLTLTVPINADPQWIAGANGGVKTPLSGNRLPAGVLQGHLTPTHMANAPTATGATVPGTMNLVEVADHTAALQQEPFKAAADTMGLPRSVTPEFAEPLAKTFKPAMTLSGSAAAPMALAASADVAATLSDKDVAQIDGLRNHAISSSQDRPPLIQAPVAPLPLTRTAGAPGWDQGLGQRILWMVDNGLNRAELRLDPPHLGSVNVKITMVDDQAQLMFQAQHPAARDALESALPKLREMFNQEGLELGETDISDNGGSADTGSDEAHNNETHAPWADGNTATGVGDHSDDSTPSPASVRPVSSSLLVDEFV